MRDLHLLEKPNVDKFVSQNELIYIINVYIYKHIKNNIILAQIVWMKVYDILIRINHKHITHTIHKMYQYLLTL